jgi:hypothetical protein
MTDTPDTPELPVTRERTFEQEVCIFILNEAQRDYNRLGYHPVSGEIIGGLIRLKRAGEITRAEMLAIYRALAGRPEKPR